MVWRSRWVNRGAAPKLELLGRLLRRREFLFGRSSGCRLRLRGGRPPGGLLGGGPGLLLRLRFFSGGRFRLRLPLCFFLLLVLLVPAALLLFGLPPVGDA